MNLGNLKEFVYLQTDPGMGSIGNIVFNMNRGKTSLQEPKPIDAYTRINFPYHKLLDDAYVTFQTQQQSEKGDPFYIDATGYKSYSESITSFLCTKAAFEIYKAAADEFDALETANIRNEDNLAVLCEIKDFVAYAILQGKRGTPHRA